MTDANTPETPPEPSLTRPQVDALLDQAFGTAAEVQVTPQTESTPETPQAAPESDSEHEGPTSSGAAL